VRLLNHFALFRRSEPPSFVELAQTIRCWPGIPRDLILLAGGWFPFSLSAKSGPHAFDTLLANPPTSSISAPRAGTPRLGLSRLAAHKSLSSAKQTAKSVRFQTSTENLW
jgi:hypothetical protein